MDDWDDYDYEPDYEPSRYSEYAASSEFSEMLGSLLDSGGFWFLVIMFGGLWLVSKISRESHLRKVGAAEVVRLEEVVRALNAQIGTTRAPQQIVVMRHLLQETYQKLYAARRQASTGQAVSHVDRQRGPDTAETASESGDDGGE